MLIWIIKRKKAINEILELQKELNVINLKGAFKLRVSSLIKILIYKLKNTVIFNNNCIFYLFK